MYKVCANVNDVEIQRVPLTPGFDLQIPEVCDDGFLESYFMCNLCT